MQLQINYYKAMEMSVTMQGLEGLEEAGFLKKSGGTFQKKKTTSTDA